MESVITNWLRGVDTSISPCQTPSTTPSRKRRIPLCEMDPNASTPTKRVRKQTVDHQIGHEEDTSEETPRPLLYSAATPALQSRSPRHSDRDRNSIAFSYSSASQSSHATGESGKSLKRKRSLSPSKGLAQLARLPYPVQQEIIGMPKNMPEPLRALTRTMRSIERGRGIIPEDFAKELRPLLAEEDDSEDWASVVSPSRAECGTIPETSFAERIVDLTVQNIRLGRSEAAWNCTVHYPLLAEACERSAQPDKVRCENITTAAIDHDRTGSSQKADFAITFVLKDSTIAALSLRGIDTLSHSSYQPLCFSPPAVSLETKLEGEHGQEAGLQLSIWAHAHARNLRTLLHKTGRPNVTIPALPLLVVQGGKWHFNYFEIRPDSAVRWAQVTIGDTATIRGVYQVFTALQRLTEWIRVVYRPWFVENIVTLLLNLPHSADAA